MTASVWPAYAKIDPERQILPVTVTERTTFEDGAVRQVRRFTAAPARRHVRAFLTGSGEGGQARDADADLARFRDWAAAHAHRPFDFPDEQGVPSSMRVVGGDGGISYRGQVSSSGARIWQLELELETT